MKGEPMSDFAKDTNVPTNDCISRQAAIDEVHEAIYEFFDICDDDEESPMTYKDEKLLEINKAITTRIKQFPSAQPEQRWIPCSERLPKAEDMYQLPEQRYLCQLEAHGVRKFCVLSRLKGAVSPFWDWYGIAVYDSDVTAWMPLPEPYKERKNETIH